jgi:hypothetical protein
VLGALSVVVFVRQQVSRTAVLQAAARRA